MARGRESRLGPVLYSPGAMECVACKVSDQDVRLHKCPICHKYICEEHKFVRSGRIFCSAFCAAYFFHEGDEDD